MPRTTNDDAERGPDTVDLHVGGRIRLRRTLMGMSQSTLAEMVGLTFQQIQKYERGANRVAASRLWEFSHALDVPVSFFFDGMETDVDAPSVATPAVRARAEASGVGDVMARRETLDLVRAYHRIADPTVRRRLFDLTKATAHLGRPA